MPVKACRLWSASCAAVPWLLSGLLKLPRRAASARVADGGTDTMASSGVRPSYLCMSCASEVQLKSMRDGPSCAANSLARLHNNRMAVLQSFAAMPTSQQTAKAPECWS